MVAVRGICPAFAVAVMVNVPLLLPDVGVTVSHVASLFAVQLTLEVTATDLFSPAGLKSRDVSESSKASGSGSVGFPSCVTEMVRMIPPPDTVTVPLLELVEVFSVTLTVIEPLLLPDAGETVSQLPALLLAVQVPLLVMDTRLELVLGLKWMSVGDTVSVGVTGWSLKVTFTVVLPWILDAV